MTNDFVGVDDHIRPVLRSAQHDRPNAATPTHYHHLALHVCCAPCCIESYRYLAEGAAITTTGDPVTFDKITAVYYNPNIAPEDEYKRRRDTFVEYAHNNDIEAVVLEYDPTTWVEAIIDDTEFGTRCKTCYTLRLGTVAAWGKESGCDALSTTLSISPWQNQDAIAAAGQQVSAAHDLTYLPFDLRPLFSAGQSKARALNLYRQTYCGCIYSKVEAEEQRAARAVRKASHHAR